MTYTCPAYHASETPEFCSVCGLEIFAGPQAAAGSAATHTTQPVITPVAAGGETCPDCGATRESDRQLFCEVCGYNFVSRTPGSGPPQTCVPPPSPASDAGDGQTTGPTLGEEATSVAAQASSDGICWELTLTVDPNLYGVPNTDAPADRPPQKFRLFEPETIIGRAGTEVRVQVPVHGDAGVSRRQALLIQDRNGPLLLRDLNSSNGTRVDGVDVLPGVDVPLADGAVIGIGAWTSITVRKIDPAGPPG